MRLTAKGRYAVMAMADLARAGADGGPVRLAEIAERQRISLSYLEQLFARLRQAGLVAGVRGPGGGYRLTRPAAEISIAAVIGAVNEPIKTTLCPEGSSAGGCLGQQGRCLTHDLWEALGGHIQRFLVAVSLEDVISGALHPEAQAPGGRGAGAA